MSTGLMQLKSAYPWPNAMPALPGGADNQRDYGNEDAGDRRLLRLLVDRGARIVLELGSLAGRDTSTLLQVYPDAEIIAIATCQSRSCHSSNSDSSVPASHLLEEFQVDHWNERGRLTTVPDDPSHAMHMLHNIGVVPDAIYVNADPAAESVVKQLACICGLFPSARVLGNGWNCDEVQTGVKFVAEQFRLPIAFSAGCWWFSKTLQQINAEAIYSPRTSPKSNKVVALTLFRRPEYTRRVLEALSRCHGIDDYDVLLHVEPASAEVVDIARSIQFARKQVVENADLFGCTHNTLAALDHGFQLADFVILLEDDTVPSPDCLQYFEWARHRYAADSSVFTIAAYSRETPGLEQFRTVKRIPYFTPWGWGTWRDRWDEMKPQWGDNPKVSWDVGVNQMRGARFQIQPHLSRTQNIGAEHGVHVPSPEWHRENHFNEFGAWSVNVEHVSEFKEI